MFLFVTFTLDIFPSQISPRHCYRTSTSAGPYRAEKLTVRRPGKKKTKEQPLFTKKSLETYLEKDGKPWVFMSLSMLPLSLLVSFSIFSTKVLAKAQRTQTNAQAQGQSAFRHRADSRNREAPSWKHVCGNEMICQIHPI